MNDIVARLQQTLADAVTPAERIDTMIEIIGKISHETPREARAMATRALRAARVTGNMERIGRCLNCVAICEYELGNYKRALEWFERARPVCEEAGSLDGMRSVFQGIGIIFVNTGRHPEAFECFQSTLELARRTGARGKEANALSSLGCVHLAIGNYSGALDYFLQAQRTLAGLDEMVIACDVDLNIGIVYAEMGDGDRAIEHYLACIERARAGNSRNLQINPVMNIGNVFMDRLEPGRALEYYLQALEIARDLGTRQGELYPLLNVGALYLDTGEFEPALRELHAALDIAESLGDTTKWRIVFGIGRCHLGLGQHAIALEWLSRSLEGSRAADMPETEVRVHEALAMCYEAMGEMALSLEHFKLCAQIKEQIWGQQQQRTVANLQVRAEIERATKERELMRREKEQLEMEMELKSRELTSMALHLVEKNQFLDALRREMSDVVQTLDGSARPRVKGLMRQVDGNIDGDQDWRVFEEQFEKIHHAFLGRLAAACPDLSRTELKVCALLKINLSTKEIASMLASSDRTIGNHRYRIRKKLGLAEDVNLTTFFTSY